MSDNKDDGASDDDGRVRGLVRNGAEIAGAAVGGALGFMVAGPVGAAAVGAGGVIVSKALVMLGEDICDRVLSPREKVRVGAALATSLDRTRERIEAGEAVRSDAFMNDGSDRPPFEEVTEGLLMAAQRAYDEKKIPYIGRLSANLNFSPALGVEAANVLVRFADDLSYQQLCLLRLAHDNEYAEPLHSATYGNRPVPPSMIALLSDLLALERSGCINMSGAAVLGMSDLDPSKAKLEGLGVSLFELMELNLIPDGDLTGLRRMLSPPIVSDILGGISTANVLSRGKTIDGGEF